MKPANPRILTINGGSSSVISSKTGRVPVRVIHTEEKWMTASTVCRVLGLG
jgi:acetate kinase